jgi:hypothetical protein
MLIFLAFFCLATFVYAIIRFRYFYHDDEMITLRYVRNFLNHDGLTWNSGEKVEGYTNFLHLIFTSIIVRITGDFLLAPRIVNFIFFGLMMFFALYLFNKRFAGTKEKRLLLLLSFLLIVAVYPGIIIWIYGGLETVTYASILFMAFSSLLYLPVTTRNSVWCGLLFTAAAMTRPDGILFFAFCAAYLFLTSIKLKHWKPFIAFMLTFLLLFGSYFLWRYSYYEQLLPNTFYAKTNFTEEKFSIGLRYVSRFAGSIILIIVAVIFLLWKNLASIKTLSVKAILLLLSVCIYSVYVIIYGGDHMLGFRFLIPLLPLIALLCAELSVRLSLRDISIAAAFLVANVFFVYIYNQDEFKNAVVTDPAAYNGALVGNYLKTALPENQLIATNSAGAIPFFAQDDRFIDMLGLCDTTISHRKNIPMLAPWQHVPGHEKGDGNYVLSRQPDIIILGPSHGSADKAWFLSDAELLSNPLFKKEYEKQEVKILVSYLKLNSMVVFHQNPAIDSLTFIYYKRNVNSYN